ncbi:MAG: hypothetical protein ACE37F_19580 [Nannocystaceae bacterium]|nr:hypothetical protein [bacterium]
MRVRSVLAVLLGLAALGCEDTPPPAAGPGSSGGASSGSIDPSTGPGAPLEGTAALIDLAAFEKTPHTEDPFDRPPDVECDFGFGLEDGFFEVETDLCHHGAFMQPLLAPVRVGDTLDFLLLHENLVSADPDAQTHLAIAFGDDVVFETTIDIPAEANFLDPSWTSSVDAPAGTPVYLHLHNHGINSYRVADLSVTYAEP